MITMHMAECVDVPRGIEGLARVRCHGVRYLSRAERNCWNALIAYLSAGLLYGSEVSRPEWFKPARKRAFSPRAGAAPSRRRPEVVKLLLEGLTYAQIGARLGLSPRTINDYASRIYREHGVHGRGALARQLGVDLASRGKSGSVEVCTRQSSSIASASRRG